MSSSSSTSSNSHLIKYIYEIPYLAQSQLCDIINKKECWEQLGEKYMQFDRSSIQNLRKEKNPSEKLLNMWGSYNHTVVELLALFKKMKLYDCMLILKPHVSEEFHKFIPEQNNYNSVASTADIQKPEENKKHVKVKFKSDESEITSLLPKVPYSELQFVTENWSSKQILGRGGFGTVYKAMWKNTMVAIKRIECKRCEREDMFRIQWEQLLREITILNSRVHENILPLYAYSIGGEMPCLIYQFMSNGTLEDKLLMRHTTEPLSWLQRHLIATGIARGLQYLHTIADKPLIHVDIKTANILLDQNLEPKIGDFGLAKEAIRGDMVKVSRIQGTRPYLPAEFLYEAQISTKVDTFSYGIVVFEMATGLRPYDPHRKKHKLLKDFVESIAPFELPTIMDQKPNREYEVVFYNFIALGKHCTKHDPHERPEMDIVFQNLNNITVLS